MNWIERIFGYFPDNGTGMAELDALLVALLLVLVALNSRRAASRRLRRSSG